MILGVSEGKCAEFFSASDDIKFIWLYSEKHRTIIRMPSLYTMKLLSLKALPTIKMSFSGTCSKPKKMRQNPKKIHGKKFQLIL
jgi:hypothetical protein